MRLLTLIVAGAITNSVVAEDKKVKDEEAILGTWKVVGVDVGTQESPYPPEAMKNWRMVFEKGDKVTSNAMDKDGKNATAGYKLDSSEKPKAFDVVGKDWKTLAIYDLDGDNLKLCLNYGADDKRPTEFKGNEKRYLILMTLKRVKDEKKDK